MEEKVRKHKKKHGNKRRSKRERKMRSDRIKIWLLGVISTVLICSTASFAWYGIKEREADSAPAEVMKPYYLNLRNPSDTANLQLSVGNLFPGDVKQIVFCVSNKNNEKSGLDMGVTSFAYAIELIHTQNLALEYKIYELNKLEGNKDGAIVVLDKVEQDGKVTEYRSYFEKATQLPLSGEDVSTIRHEQAGLVSTMPVNAGEYLSFTKSQKNKDSQGKALNLRLEASTEDGKPTFDTQYFVVEIDWKNGAEAVFEKYEKETDMIYLLVEALQPKPQKKETS